jgi:hypothetical protein
VIRLNFLIINVFVLLVLPGCSMVQGFVSILGPPATATPNSRLRESTLERVTPSVRQELDRSAHDAQAAFVTAQDSVEQIPAHFKRRLVVDALKQPWEGLTSLEKHGLLLAEVAEGGAVNLPGLLDILESGVDRTSAFHKAVPLPTTAAQEELVIFLKESLAVASEHREKAVANLTDEERRFLFAHPKSLVQQFSPQISTLTDQTIARAKADIRFAEIIEEHVDYANLIAAAQVLARLANAPWLHHMATAFPQPIAPAKVPVGVTGDVLYVEETPYGLIVIGGTGTNTYELDNRFGLVIDLGGADLYRGMIAASTDADHGNAAVIDLSGNDTYQGASLGLATGRLGVGLLIDQSGNDAYQLDLGSGGTGFGGLGILFDVKGNDTYMGSRLTQGAAIGGLGLLLDAGGNDQYTSHGFAIGFGGPQGVGAVIDVEGDDRYQCGNKIPSAYNAEDAPKGKPGDPLFQYDCFGLGTGSGKRIITRQPEGQALNLAGGLGLLLDIDGHDRYQSANFSQGHGYFFGVGLLLDLDGDDEYQAARYGIGSSAHYGVALFNDRHGDDRYGSTGPFYNGGVAWDHGVSLMLESGNGKDRYGFEQSTGLGGANYSAWGLFIEEGGSDQYKAKSGFGRSSELGLGAFFDLNGKDDFVLPEDSSVQTEQRPADNRVILYPKGGLFVDR